MTVNNNVLLSMLTEKEKTVVFSVLDNHGVKTEQRPHILSSIMADSGSCVYKAVTDQFTQMSTARVAHRDKRYKANTGCRLTPDRLSKVQSSWEEYLVDASDGRHMEHSLAYVSRVVEMIHHMRNVPRVKSVDKVWAIDIGGNYARHFMHNWLVHSCCPLLDARDVTRHVDRQAQLRDYGYSGEKGALARYRQFMDNTHYWYCNERAELCGVRAPIALSLHSAYDMTKAQMACAMVSHGCEVLYGSFIYNVMVLNLNSGDLEDLECHFEVEKRTKDRRDWRIKFTFVGDPSLSYDHSYERYVQLAQDSVVTISGVDFTYEVTEIRGSICMFRMTRVLAPCGSVVTPTMRYLYTGPDPEVTVKSYIYSYAYDVSDTRGFEPYVFTAPRSLIDTAMAYALRVGDLLTRDNIYRFVRSINAKLIVNGTTVQAADQADLVKLNAISTYVFLSSVRKRFEDVALTAILTKGEEVKRMRASSSLNWVTMAGRICTAKFWVCFSSCFSDVNKTIGDVLDTWRSVSVGEILHLDMIPPCEIIESTIIQESLSMYVDDAEPLAVPDIEDNLPITSDLWEAMQYHLKSSGQLSKLGIMDSLASVSIDTESTIVDSVSEVDQTSEVNAAIAEYAEYSTRQADSVEAHAQLMFNKCMIGTELNMRMASKFSGDRGNPNIIYFSNGERISSQIYTEEQYMAGIDVHTRKFITRENFGFPKFIRKLFVIDELRIFNSRKLAEMALNILRKSNLTIPRIILVRGVVGCGKTRKLLKSFRPGDIVFASNRDSAISIRDKLVALYGDSVRRFIRTLDSYLMNPDVKTVTGIVRFDECYMSHSGESYAATLYTGAKEVIAYGDPKQIPFINRVAGFYMKYGDFSSFYKVYDMIISKRCPQDVAVAIFGIYGGMIRTLSEVETSLSCEYLFSVEDLPIRPEIKYLVFTQADKAILKAKGLNVVTVASLMHTGVSTVHEAQGDTFDVVYLVRLSPLNIPIFESQSHCLVALTRHTKSLVYWTRGRSDGITKLIALSKDVSLRSAVIPTLEEIKAQDELDI